MNSASFRSLRILTKALPVCAVLLLLSPSPANAFWGWLSGKVAKVPTAAKSVKAAKAPTAAGILGSPAALPDEEIARFASLVARPGGTARVGEELGRRKLPNEVLEDTFLRIAIHQGRIPRREAEGMFSRLSGVPGFRTTLRKTVGNSEVGTAGHLYELRLADSAAGRGMKVVSIGEKFDDGLKRAPTDIDLLLQHGRTTFAIEAKNYAPSTTIPLDRFRADLDSLAAYREAHGRQVVPVFSMSNRPADVRQLKQLQDEARKRKVELIFGNAQESAEQIRFLGELR